MSLPERLSSLSNTGDRGGGTEHRRDSDGSDYSGTAAERQLVQRCVIIQKDERGYGLTVSGDNPVYVASVKPEGAAAKAGVQKDDRIVKVNGTLVLNRNHIDVVKLIRSGSYVALTLMGKPNLNEGSQHPVPPVAEVNNTPSNRSSLITAPQPVDPDTDRGLLHQKVHMTRVMLEQAREDFLKQQKQYVRTPSEKLHAQLLEKERTVQKLENQLQALTGGEEPTAQGSQRFSDLDQTTTDSSVNSWQQSAGLPSAGRPKHVKQVSEPTIGNGTSTDMGGVGRVSGLVMRSKSDAAWRRERAGVTHSTFYVGLTGGAGEALAQGGGKLIRHRLKRWKSYCSSICHRQGETTQMQTLRVPQATSLPATTDVGSMSDSPHTSPCISPTPVHSDNTRHENDDSAHVARVESCMEDPVSVPSESTSIASAPQEIITIDDEDVNSDEEQAVDTGPFSDIRLLEKKPAHLAVFLHYLISNSDPSTMLFYLVTDMYKQTAGNTKDLRKWGYEIFSTFLVPKAPLHVEVDENLVTRVNEMLMVGNSRNENELILRGMFDGCRADLGAELSEQLGEFRNMRAMGLGSIFGAHELLENMDKNSELRMIEKYLVPHLQHCTEDSSNLKLSDRDLAMGWALATILRQAGMSKTSASGVLERVQSFIMKDKRGFKLGSRSAKAKGVKGHQFNLQHFYVPTMCGKCESLIWGVGYQGFLCQSCEMGVHKQCVDFVVEVCSGKKRGRRSAAFTTRPRIASQLGGSEALGQPTVMGETRSPLYGSAEAPGIITTHPVLKEEDPDLTNLSSELSVRSIVKTYQDLASPIDPTDRKSPGSGDRKGSTDLNRSESLKGKGDKSERPARRAKSDVDREDMFHALSTQSGSSSASSLSNRSGESPSNSSEHVNETRATRAQQYDSDLEVEELPPLKQVLGDEVSKLKPKEKKRQEVINELFHTEKAHLRNLKVLDLLFNRPMLLEGGITADLAHALFPNMDEIISLHAAMNKAMKERRSQNLVVGDVGDILLQRFDGEPGNRFKKACAGYCRNQSHTLDRLKQHRRKDQRLSQFLVEIEADKLCRKLELKDHVPCQMQRLTKYPMLIENLLKYTKSTSSEEYKNLERALELSKQILAHVNQAVRDCQNYYKLRDMQKKLESRAIDTSTDQSLLDIKELDLTQHMLVFDGPLVWRLRSHRLIDLHVVLLEDILVLLQRVDDKLVLKCQSINLHAIGNDFKYTHSPVLKLQNLLARDVATDKKAFFVINTSDTGPQIYELVAQTQDARKIWCRLINEKAEEQKRTLSNARKRPRIQESLSSEAEEIIWDHNRILGSSQGLSNPPADEGQAAAPAEPPAGHDMVDNLGSLATADFEPKLIQPDQVSVSGAVTAEAQPVLSSIERLRRSDQMLEQALLEKETIVAEILRLSHSDYQRMAQQGGSGLQEEDSDSEQTLIVLCFDANNRLIQLLNAQASAFALDSHQQGSESGSGSGSGSSSQPASLPSESDSTGSSQLRQSQEQLAQGAAGQNVNVPMPMNQLQGLALEMKNILSSLMRVMEVKEEERQTLQLQLETAQKQLEMLKEVQQQIMAQQPPSTPQSRPLSFVSVTSSISEVGEATDSEHTEDDSASVLNVAQTQELPQEMLETAETVTHLHAELQPQVATSAASSLPGTNQDEDSDEDSYLMMPENLRLPDDNYVGEETSFPSVPLLEEEDPGELEREGSLEPMTTDLDDGGEDVHVTPTPSPTSTDMTEVGEEEDRESITTIKEDRDDVAVKDAGDCVSTVKDDKDGITVIEEEGDNIPDDGDGQQVVGDEKITGEHWDKADEESENGENNNLACQDSELTKPIKI